MVEVEEYLKLDPATQEEISADGYNTEDELLMLGKSRTFLANLAFIKRGCDRTKVEVYIDNRLGKPEETKRESDHHKPPSFRHSRESGQHHHSRPGHQVVSPLKLLISVEILAAVQCRTLSRFSLQMQRRCIGLKSVWFQKVQSYLLRPRNVLVPTSWSAQKPARKGKHFRRPRSLYTIFDLRLGTWQSG